VQCNQWKTGQPQGPPGLTASEPVCVCVHDMIKLQTYLSLCPSWATAVPAVCKQDTGNLSVCQNFRSFTEHQNKPHRLTTAQEALMRVQTSAWQL